MYRGWDNEIILAMRNLSLSMFVVAIVDQVFWQSNQLLLGMKMGAESVAIYAIASQIYINYMNIALAVSGTLLPKITAMVTNRCSDEEFQSLFLKIGRLQFYFIILNPQRILSYLDIAPSLLGWRRFLTWYISLPCSSSDHLLST